MNETDTDYKDYVSYVRRARAVGSRHRLVLLRIALDAQPVHSIYGQSELAISWTSLETLAESVSSSRSTVQRIIHQLERWGDLQVVSCTGRCLVAQFNHHGTNHYMVPLPDGAQPWGRKERRHVKKSERLRTAKKAHSKDA